MRASVTADTFNFNQRLVNIYDGPSYQENNGFLDIPVIRMGTRTTTSCPAPTQLQNYQADVNSRQE
jgi:hypothetical protein